MADVSAPAPDLIVISFTERPTLTVWPHAVGTAPVMPATHWAGHDASDAADLYSLPGTDDPGGGPLYLTELSATGAVSSRNPGYSLATAPDTVEYVVYPDVAAAVVLRKDGEARNELTRYRYDVVVRKAPATVTETPAVDDVATDPRVAGELAAWLALRDGATVPEAQALLDATPDLAPATPPLDPNTNRPGHWIWRPDTRSSDQNRGGSGRDGSLAGLANEPGRGRWVNRLVPEVRAFLRARLPEHMCPTALVVLDALPLRTNGKVDRDALPEPDVVGGSGRTASVAASDELGAWARAQRPPPSPPRLLAATSELRGPKLVDLAVTSVRS